MFQNQPDEVTDSVDGQELIVTDPVVYDIPSYCRAHRKSRSALYDEWSRGEGPDYYREGGRVKITGEAARRHRIQLEAKARAEREARVAARDNANQAA